MRVSRGAGLSSHPPIQDIIQSRLRSSPYPSVKRLKSSVKNGRVVLRGRVRSFYEKQIAQEAVAHLDGVEQVVNRVKVV